MNIKNINARTIGLVFASTLLIPSNYGLNILGLNFEDLPIVVLFLFLFYKKITNHDPISNIDKVFLTFIFSFILYSNIFTQNFEIFNQTNLRFYFYLVLSFSLLNFFKAMNIMAYNLIRSLIKYQVASLILHLYLFSSSQSFSAEN